MEWNVEQFKLTRTAQRKMFNRESIFQLNDDSQADDAIGTNRTANVLKKFSSFHFWTFLCFNLSKIKSHLYLKRRRKKINKNFPFPSVFYWLCITRNWDLSIFTSHAGLALHAVLVDWREAGGQRSEKKKRSWKKLCQQAKTSDNVDDRPMSNLMQNQQEKVEICFHKFLQLQLVAMHRFESLAKLNSWTEQSFKK